jgi:uncharacterized protein YcbX
MAHVTRISIAPVKALSLVFPDEVELGVGGVPGDRRFWLTDADGRLFNNKRLGPLALVRPNWDEESGRLALTFPDGRVVSGRVELGPVADTVLYGEPLTSFPVIGPWEAALSEFAGEPLRLYQAPAGALDRGRNGGAATLVSTASLARLGEVAGTASLDGRRFRMLFEVDGVGANEEDAWIDRRVRIGEAEIVFRGDVGRCVVTSQDPDTGIADIDTLRALALYRREGRTEPLPLGIYGEVVKGGRVVLGDSVTVEPNAAIPARPRAL